MNDYMTALHQRFYREPDGLYSFQKEEEQRACETVEQEVNRDG